jgi:hypothetical protein
MITIFPVPSFRSSSRLFCKQETFLFSFFLRPVWEKEGAMDGRILAIVACGPVWI